MKFPILAQTCWLMFFLLLLSVEVFCQAFSQTIKDDRVPINLVNEALKGHDELIKGTISQVLSDFIDDSLLGTWNEDEIRMILSTEEFRFHSTRIDTTYAMELETNNQVKHYIVFRDIHYIGNNRFMQFRTCFTYFCNRGQEVAVIKKKITFGRKEITNQRTWGRGSWY